MNQSVLFFALCANCATEKIEQKINPARILTESHIREPELFNSGRTIVPIIECTHIEMMIVGTIRWRWWFISATTEVAATAATTTAVAASRNTADEERSLKYRITLNMMPQ